MNQIHQYISENNLWDKKLSLKKGAFVFSSGNYTPWVYFVASGAFIITKELEGEEQVLRLVYKNNWVSALDAFLFNKQTEFSMSAIKTSEIYAISKEKYFEIIKKLEGQDDVPYLNLMLQGLIKDMMERELDLLILDPKKRIERVLERSPHLFQEIPNKYIALYLNMTPETLSRVLNS